MECERIRASTLWKGPAAAFLCPEAAALVLREDGYGAAGLGGQAHHSGGGGGGEFVDVGNYKGMGFVGGDDFSVDDLLDLGGAEEASSAENMAACQGGGGCWGQGKPGSSDSNSGLTSEAGVADAAEPLVPQVGDITDLEWVSQFVDDSYAYVPPCPPYSVVMTKAAVASASKQEPQHRPLQFVPNPTHSRSPSAGSVTSPVAGVWSLSLKRSWSSSSVLLEDPLGTSAPYRKKSRSKRVRTADGARAWAMCAGTLLHEPLNCSSASSSSSCSSTSSSSLSSRLFLDQSYNAGSFDLGAAQLPRPRGRPPLHKKHAQQQQATGFAAMVSGGSSDQCVLLVRKEKQPLKPKKKKGRKPKLASSWLLAASSGGAAGGAAGETAEDSGPGSGRRCSHCGVQKTPQWRAGPMGAKTLCNACGVRYKSGRLLPEYRPACSPTFVSHVHSNSHRKVLEMRRNKEMMLHQPQQQKQLLAAVAVAPAPAPPQPVVTPQAMPAQQMVC